MTKTPKLSIIIVNTNQKYFSRICVEAIEKSKVSFEYEIIIVDNGSTDESLPDCKKMQKEGRIRLVEAGRNLGYGQANNLGSKHAKGEFILISNPDILVREDTMQKMVDYIEARKDVGLVGPKLVYYNGQIQASCRRHMNFADLIIKRTPLKFLFKERIRQYLMEDFDHSQTQDVDLIVGAYFIMRTKVYKRIGGFDPLYFLFMEDYDLCRTLQKEGLRTVYYPEAVAEHYHKRLSEGNMFWLVTRKVFWYHLASAIKYFWKWRNQPIIKPLTHSKNESEKNHPHR